MKFVDTNYFLRFLIDDGSKHHSTAVRLFERESSRKKSLITSVVVFFEVYWVLTSFYQKSRTGAIEIMRQLLKMVFIEFEARRILEKAIVRADKGAISLEDCFNLEWARARGVQKIASFDKKLTREWKKAV